MFQFNFQIQFQFRCTLRKQILKALYKINDVFPVSIPIFHVQRDNNVVKKILVYTDPWKKCCIIHARPVVSDVTLLRKKHYAPID